MEEVLSFITSLAGVKGCLVVGKDGLVIESRVWSGINDELIGAMIAGVFTNVENSMEELEGGELVELLIEGKGEKVFAFNLETALLIVLLEKEVNLGLVKSSVEETIEKLKALL